MPLIKRYPNRKLYDTGTKRYITLDEIASLIRQGQEVHVVDYATGEDLTAVTLSQIILEQEKKRNGFLPQTVLAGLIQAGGQRLSTLRRTLATPLELARHVDEEIERRIQVLIRQGEVAAEEGLRLRDKLLAQDLWFSGASWLCEEDLERALVEHGVPTRDEFQDLLERLDALDSELESLVRHSGPTAPE